MDNSYKKNSTASTYLKTRNSNIDIVKGWSMLTIILFHCSQSCVPGFLGQILGNPWNVPMFFIVAGFYLKEESLSNTASFILGKVKRLYIPATIIYALSVLLHNIFVYIGWYPLGSVHPANGQPFTYYGIHETCIRLFRVLCAGGSGELAMGAMWFLYTLLYLLVAMAIIYWTITKIYKDTDKRFHAMTICMLLAGVTSCVLSQKLDITISRFSTAMTALFLVWWGMIVNQKWQWKYDKLWALAIAVITFVFCNIIQTEHMVLAHNQYQDLLHLVVGSTAAIYIIGYIGRKIEDNIVGRFLALMGKESLYLMAFHIIGFFLCNSLMKKIGVFGPEDKTGLYTYNIGDNYLLLFLYVACGISTSFALLYAWRGIIKFTSCK